MFMLLLSLVYLIWMNRVVKGIMKKKAPELLNRLEREGPVVT